MQYPYADRNSPRYTQKSHPLHRRDKEVLGCNNIDLPVDEERLDCPESSPIFPYLGSKHLSSRMERLPSG